MRAAWKQGFGLFFGLLSIVALSACEESALEDVHAPLEAVENVSANTKHATDDPYPANYYASLRRKVYVSQATLGDIQTLLTEKNKYALTNTMHALFAMRGHRGVLHMLEAMWERRKAKYPDWNWLELSRPPVSIALASTLNRIHIVDLDYQRYIRSFKADSNEFNRAQVAMALGFNGHPKDTAYLHDLVNGENAYVAQTAIVGLGAMGGDQAKAALIALWQQHKGSSKGELVAEMLQKAYKFRVAHE